MSFTPLACVTAVAAALGTVPDIGIVHPRRRVMRDEADVRRLVFDPTNDRICGWFISPAANVFATSERHPGFGAKGTVGGGQVLTTLQFQVEGYFGLSDADDSETTFRDLCWAAADLFNGYGLLDIDGIVVQLPTNIEVFGYAMLAQMYFLHYARIGLGFTGKTRP